MARPRLPAEISADGESAPFHGDRVRVGPYEVVVSTSGVGRGLRLDWEVRNATHRTLHPERIAMGFDVSAGRILEHGWQSWSPVRVTTPAGIEPERRRLPAWRRAEYWSEPDRAGRVVTGEPFLVDDEGVIGFLGGERHFASVVAGREGISAVALLDGVPLQPGASRRLHPVWAATGDPGPLYSEYAARWGREAGARTGAVAPAGWCSWHQFANRFTPEDLRAIVPVAAAHGLDLVQVDDGFQASIGDWTKATPAWGHVGSIAATVRDAGVRPGIWTAPFLVDESGAVASAHPEWLLRDHWGRPVRAMHNPLFWGGWALALDPTHPGVIDHLTTTFATLVDEGFEHFKIDFCYAAALAGRRAEDVTRADALRRGLDAIRAAVGDATVVACGCPFGPAVGAVDAMRVSPDVSIRWTPRRAVPGVAGSSARTAIEVSTLRAPLHRRLWANDPDCVLLRPVDTDLEPWQRRMLAAVVAGLGGWLVVSDDLRHYGDEEWDLLDRLRALQAAAQGPADLVDPFSPTPVVRCGDLDLELGLGFRAEPDGGEPGVLDAAGDAGWCRLRDRSPLPSA